MGLCHHPGVTARTPARAPARASRVRLDQLLVDRGLVESRSRAQALLIGGRVRVGDGDAARLDRKPGDLVDPATTLDVVAPEPYVSRGGHKLAAALDAFGIDPADRICLDVGASTGGFTDVLLQRGASRVYALDVGRGQLAEALRRDPRVISLERVNARELRADSLADRISLAVIDVSFISLRLVLPALPPLAKPRAPVVALVKPQFEVGRADVGKGGIVRDEAARAQAVADVAAAARGLGFAVLGETTSPITGGKGNVEFLLHLRAP